MVFRSLNYIIRWSSNVYYIWCSYYVLCALYNLTHLNILIITMWSGTEWNICSNFPSFKPLLCSLWVEILSFAIDVELGWETCFGYLYVSRSVNVPLRNKGCKWLHVFLFISLEFLTSSMRIMYPRSQNENIESKPSPHPRSVVYWGQPDPARISWTLAKIQTHECKINYCAVNYWDLENVCYRTLWQ